MPFKNSQFATLLVCSLLTFSPATIGGTPPCALTCLTTAVSSDGNPCGVSDFSCLCKNKNFLDASDKCFKNSCTGDDLKAARSGGAEFCKALGVNIKR
ncbi:hypothetical protein MJO28_014963 [Puccinia striiformis f. sp. tritici]|uniref:CFEM domain-containing protein n=4 Tax=Puccinia striiformis TaxID=27350 RepID=A0A0L0UY02_9BASI|nr:hypothetical protein Pst134EA_027825 [Puccinia striiformis f. sp. tritici]KAI9608067.1 hypothetical protein H4Q26_005521 [Puccinia striiformis f. sp. tritici PST-130]KNE91624.1 hypothetical protein PSTG_14933 [Puccinia striiformis f. sp. tritici PST-78]POW11652.1 hypothetical protein PSTT_05199 [Puccinia striiformis]KAH9448514.1 hypothetical protein Pst134EA_027825 [Puccinia striiformis f. sp. tritici]KAI7937413.1 hypothetical protein MJO29_014728 [Puccinia striiformis f. sp. tritici]